MEQTQKVKLEKLLHYNMTCIGGFMGTCAICGFEGNFASAQTGNIMSLTKELVGGDLFQVSIRLGALILFCLSMAVSFLIKRFLKPDMERLSLMVDGGCLLLSLTLPEGIPAIIRLYPVFIASSFQWGTFSGAGGYNSASIFTTNNLKQCVLSWTQYVLDREEAMLDRAWFYTWTVTSFITGAVTGCISMLDMGNKGIFIGLAMILLAELICRRKNKYIRREQDQMDKNPRQAAAL